MRRDRLTFAMMIGIPLLQLTLFGFAINNDPKHLPTAVLLADQSTFARSLIAGMQETDYFHVLYHIVPGLMGVVLTMTMVLMTGLAMTRERETMENLLAMPVRPLEVMLGKIVPYVFVGYLQAGLILVAARLVFDVPMLGDLAFLALSMLCLHHADRTNLTKQCDTLRPSPTSLSLRSVGVIIFESSNSKVLDLFPSCPEGPDGTSRFDQVGLYDLGCVRIDEHTGYQVDAIPRAALETRGGYARSLGDAPAGRGLGETRRRAPLWRDAETALRAPAGGAAQAALPRRRSAEPSREPRRFRLRHSRDRGLRALDPGAPARGASRRPRSLGARRLCVRFRGGRPPSA